MSVLTMAQKLRARYSSNVELVLSGQSRVGDIRHNYADLRRIGAVLGWSPQFDFDEGLGRFVDWVRQQANSPDLSVRAIDEMRVRGLHRSTDVAGQAGRI
jgi:dTDP-L-rhamnose 4-epimerase